MTRGKYSQSGSRATAILLIADSSVSGPSSPDCALFYRIGEPKQDLYVQFCSRLFFSGAVLSVIATIEAPQQACSSRQINLADAKEWPIIWI
jgi:hypothetical protein